MITNHPKTRMGDKVLDQLLAFQRPFSRNKKQFQAPKAQMITNQPKMRIPDVVLDQLWLPGAYLLAKP